MAKLVIVESRAKAKTIGKYLGDDYEVTASMGHIRDLPASQLGIDVCLLYTSIMTIHRSKGLQFPVVFVGDTARKFNASDIRQPVLVHRLSLIHIWR